MNEEAKKIVIPFNYIGKTNELPSAELVRKMFDYDPLTGILLWKWHPTSTKVMKGGKIAGKDSKGYLKVKVFRTYHWAHRLAWVHYYGEPPNGCIDHMNAIKKDNSIANLRVVTYSGNQQNRSEHRKKLAIEILRLANCGFGSCGA
jgi:hypothetical protein